MRPCRSWVLAGAAIAAIAGCTGADLDTGFEIGVDDSGSFAPLFDGDEVRIERGFQGGVHIALAAVAEQPGEGLVELRVTLSHPGATPFAASRFLVQFEDNEVAGLAVVLPSVDIAANQQVRIDAAIGAQRSTRMAYCVPPPK